MVKKGDSMKSFVFKNITFNKNEIIIDRKKEQIKIPIDNIQMMRYTRKTFLNYFLINGLSVSPGWLQIYFINRIGWRKGYAIKIKYDDLKLLPKGLFEKIEID